MMLALYIHWPFCKAKCPYCDFNSHVRESVDQERWRAAMLRELRHMAALMPDATLGSIFFGGGTPSLMPPQTAAALIDEATRLFHCDADIEITLEANPTSSEAALFEAFRTAGVNRVSLGVQSLRDDALAFLGREHSASEALKAVGLAQTLFKRYSFDLIYARPEQDAGQWQAELEEALGYAGDHLSLYQLTIEPNTAFHHDYYHKKAFKLPKDSLSEELFLITQQVMEAAGMPAYEISNHARAGQESRHNMAYWTGAPYLGVGTGAHGRILTDPLSLSDARDQMDRPRSRALGSEAGSHAVSNWYATATYKSPERWLERVQRDGHAIEHCTPITSQERAIERIMTGLRLRKGVALDDSLRAQLNEAKLTFYAQQGLLDYRENHIAATPRGWLVLNQLLSEIIL